MVKIAENDKHVRLTSFSWLSDKILIILVALVPCFGVLLRNTATPYNNMQFLCTESPRSQKKKKKLCNLSNISSFFTVFFLSSRQKFVPFYGRNVTWFVESCGCIHACPDSQVSKIQIRGWRRRLCFYENNSLSPGMVGGLLVFQTYTKETVVIVFFILLMASGHFCLTFRASF